MRLTAWRLALLLAGVAACGGTSEPKGSTLAGEYRLVAVDGKSLPADAFGTTYYYGALTLRGNGTWSEVDTLLLDIIGHKVAAAGSGTFTVSGTTVELKSQPPFSITMIAVLDGTSLTVQDLVDMRYERQ